MVLRAVESTSLCKCEITMSSLKVAISMVNWAAVTYCLKNPKNLCQILPTLSTECLQEAEVASLKCIRNLLFLNT